MCLARVDSMPNSRLCPLWLCLMLTAGVLPWAVERARAADPEATKLPSAVPEASGLDGAALEPIDSLVQQGIEEGEMPGAVVMIGHRGSVVFHRAYGHRQLAPSAVPMTEDTLFDMASITKPVVTATCVMLLVEWGRIGLEDPVADHLPEFASQGKNAVTIKQLLLHTGGLIPDNPLSDYDGGAGPATEKLLGIDLNYPPGSKFRYSDVGFMVLGELVERVTGKDIHAFSREAIFAPLGMSDSGFLPASTLCARAAATEQRDGRWMTGEVHDPRAHALGGVAGHAGLFSTASDLAVYAQMMINGGQYGGARVLAPETVATMTAAYTVTGGERGLGWDKRSAFSSNRGATMTASAFGHGGFTGTVLWIDPQLELFVIFLSSRLHPDGSGSVNRLAGQIATIAADAAISTVGSGSPTHDPNVSVRRCDDGSRDRPNPSAPGPSGHP